MNRRRQLTFGGIGLALAAIAIWARDTHWLAAPGDHLPLALGLPLAFFHGRPWKTGGAPLTRGQRVAAISAAVGFGCGWIVGSLTLLAFSLTALAMIWAKWGFTARLRRVQLAWLVLLSFPWLVIDWPSIGWVFRLSAAAAAEGIFGFLQMPTLREGTSLNVMGVPIEIEAACAGWNLLQLTLLAGVAFGAPEIRSTRRFTLLLCLLPGIAWLANVLRILILSAIALSFDRDLASGALHGFTGLAVLGGVLAMTRGLCNLLEPPAAITCRTAQVS